VNTTAYPASTASADLAVPLVQVLNVDHSHVLPPGIW
jgi:hypothetical protein